jgi:hypothetical protein
MSQALDRDAITACPRCGADLGRTTLAEHVRDGCSEIDDPTRDRQGGGHGHPPRLDVADLSEAPATLPPEVVAEHDRRREQARAVAETTRWPGEREPAATRVAADGGRETR